MVPSSAVSESKVGRDCGSKIQRPCYHYAPGHGKSELVDRYLPAWWLGTFPNQRIILTSYEAEFAASWGGKARDIFEKTAHLWGRAVNMRSSAASRWDLKNFDGGMITAGAGGPITGKGASPYN